MKDRSSKDVRGQAESFTRGRVVRDGGLEHDAARARRDCGRVRRSA